MGEFHLQRKLFDRVKRTKTQEASVVVPAQSSTQNDNNTDPSSSELASAPEQNHLSKGSRSMPQLSSMMIRQSSNETSSSSGGEMPSSLANVAIAVAQTNEKRKLGRKARSKFISASRAISLLRRAASTLTSAGSGSSSQLMGRRDGTGGQQHQSSIERQNTADSGQSQGSNNVLRPPSSTNSSTCLGKEVPSFIMPKMGVLRLPLVCRIMSLDGELMREVFVHRYELGQYLIESLKVSVGIKDCKYFGFKLAKSFDDQEDLRNPWLDLNESVCKQLKSIKFACSSSASASFLNGQQQNNAQLQVSTNNSRQRSIDFYLRIKFYPPNLGRVQDSFLRHYLYLQLRRDLRLGKLTSSMNNLTLLMACVLQYEFGDSKPELIERVPELNILQNQDLIEEQAINLWRIRLAGLKRHQAQMQFLRAAVILETYGFDYYPVRDHQRQRAYLLGFNYAGVKTIRNGRIVHHFRWHTISKISYERRMIIFHIYPSENSKRKQILGFKCLSNEDCQNLYLRLLEQKYFFTVDLAYFDKSIRRPSCLYSPSDNQLNWTAEVVSSADGPLSASTSFGPIQLPASSQARAEQLLELDQMDEPGESSNERSDTSSPIHQRQQPAACPDCLHGNSMNPHQASSFGASCAPQPGSPRDDLCRCAFVAPNHASPTNQPDQVQPEAAYLSSWLQETGTANMGAGSPRPTRPKSSVQLPRTTNMANHPQASCPIETVAASGASFSASLWTKMVSCAATRPVQVSRKLAELAEWALVQPAAFLQNQLAGFGSHSTPDRRLISSDQQQLGADSGHLQGVFVPIFKLCLIILVMNFLFRLADNCSSALIELLTMSKPASTDSSSQSSLAGDEPLQP